MTTKFPRTGGMLRRRIALHCDGARESTGWVEDDFHHFGVTIEYEGGIVTRVSASAPRAPWSTCPGAAIPLRALVGKPLIERASDIGSLIDMRMQCTHMFDLAGLVLAHAWHGRDRRSYEAIVPDRELLSREGRHSRFSEAQVTLDRDGARVMEWDVAEPLIAGPAPYAGQSLSRGFREWTETLPVETAEQAFVLRRAIMVASGRMVDLDRFATAAETLMPPACHSYQPETRVSALRNTGTTRDYTDDGSAMLAGADSRA